MTPHAMLFTGTGQPLMAVPQTITPPHGAAIRVRVLCCTLCQSDLSTYSGRRIEATPTVLGHEVVGAIEAFGPEAIRNDAKIGDRVTWAVVASCGACSPCRDELPQKCERGLKYGHHATPLESPDGGGLADTITLAPGTAWFRVPDTLSTPVASLANCAGATAAAVLDAAGDVTGRTVLIFGAGLLGIMACAMAAKSGATAIVAVDPDAACRERARTFGATVTLDPADAAFETMLKSSLGPRGADVALELAGRSTTVEQCLAHVRIGGTVVLAGTVSPGPAVPLDPQQFVRRMLTLRGVHNYQPRHLRVTLNFLTDSHLPWESLIAGTFPLEQADAAFAAAKEYPGRRIAVIPLNVTEQR